MLLFSVAAAVPVLVIFLMAVALWASFTNGDPGRGVVYTLKNYVAIYADPFTVTALINTLWFSLISTTVALLFGVPIAWLAERTTMSHKALLFALMVVDVIVPGFFVAMGWVLLLHPRIGFLNIWLRNITGISTVSVDINTIGGMGFVEGLSLAPLAFIMTAAAFRVMNPVLEEAARVHGMVQIKILRKITLPLALPALAATAVYIFVIGLAAFDVPAVMGLSRRIYTFSTFLYQLTINSDASPNYGIPAAVGVLMLAAAIVMTLWYSRFLRSSERYEVVSGKSYRVRRIELGRTGNRLAWIFCAFFLMLTIGIPLLLIGWVAFLPYAQPPSLEAIRLLTSRQFDNLDWTTFFNATKNTMLLMIVAPTATIMCAVPLAWVIVRSRSRWRYLFEFLSFLPHAMPPIIFAFAALLVALFVLRNAVPIYGTVWLIGIIYVVEGIAFVSRVLNTSLLQIHREIDEVGYVSGLGLIGVLRRITVPLLLPTILGVWLWRALVTYRELTVAGTLFTPRSITLPVMVWNLWTSGGSGAAAAVTLIVVAVLAPLIMVYWLTVGRRIIGW